MGCFVYEQGIPNWLYGDIMITTEGSIVFPSFVFCSARAHYPKT